MQAGVTRCNLDDSGGSTFSGSTCNSPMTNREGQQPLLGIYILYLFVILLKYVCHKENNLYIQQTTIFLLYVKLVYSDKEESREKKGNENEKKRK